MTWAKTLIHKLIASLNYKTVTAVSDGSAELPEVLSAGRDIRRPRRERRAAGRVILAPASKKGAGHGYPR
ncbi:MAG: hypothetical protein KGK15_01650 [Burkholderiales bacterium]|nr:hypothetical protein [Burkholderiales bacterium]MDE2286941.1 hypothetical protein [Burkholderiales bacterium]